MHRLATFILIGLLAACAGPPAETPDATGVVIGTVGRPVPAGLEGGYIVEIDGQWVPWSARGHRLAPGPHVIRVVPWIQGPTHQVPSAEALATYWPNEPVTIDVVAGRTYFVGLRMLDRFYYAGYHGRWEAVVIRVSGAGDEEEVPVG